MFNGACATKTVLRNGTPVRINESEFDPTNDTECDELGNAIGGAVADEPQGGTYAVVEQDGRWYVTTASGAISKAARFEQGGYDSEVAAWTATTAK